MCMSVAEREELRLLKTLEKMLHFLWGWVSQSFAFLLQYFWIYMDLPMYVAFAMFHRDSCIITSCFIIVVPLNSDLHYR